MKIAIAEAYTINRTLSGLADKVKSGKLVDALYRHVQCLYTIPDTEKEIFKITKVYLRPTKGPSGTVNYEANDGTRFYGPEVYCVYTVTDTGQLREFYFNECTAFEAVNAFALMVLAHRENFANTIAFESPMLQRYAELPLNKVPNTGTRVLIGEKSIAEVLDKGRS